MSPFRLTFLAIGLLFTLAQVASGQGETHLYLFNLAKKSDGSYHVFGPRYLSTFNRKGYTNQPFFTPTGDILVSVRMENEKQNDIWLLSPSTRKCRKLTQTATNEYSPQIVPGGGRYSVLRQVEGEPLDQQILIFGLYGGKINKVTPEIKDIGYYAWLSASELVLYRIDGESNRMSSMTVKDQVTKRITTSVGRSLLADGKGSVYFIHKFSTEFWYLKKYSQNSTTVEIVTETPSKSEDLYSPDHFFSPAFTSNER